MLSSIPAQRLVSAKQNRIERLSTKRKNTKQSPRLGVVNLLKDNKLTAKKAKK